MSAGPYPPQNLNYSVSHPINANFHHDHLGQEVSNVMNSTPSGPSSSTSTTSNRAQSVPLLQMSMTDTGTDIENITKSHPNTPLTNQSFYYGTNPDFYSSHPSSYAPTPVPSEYCGDFGDCSNLDYDNDPTFGGGSEDSGVTSLEGIESAFGNLSSNTDFTSVINIPETSLGLIDQSFSTIHCDEVPSSLQGPMPSPYNSSVKDQSNFVLNTQSAVKDDTPQTTQSSLTFGDSSQLTLNALNVNTFTTTFDTSSYAYEDGNLNELLSSLGD